MIKIPLTISSKDEAKELRSTILCLLGDRIYQRHYDKYNTDVTIPEPLASSKALGTPSRRSTSSLFGSIISFKDNSPFAMLFLHYDPSEGVSYNLGTHAGWSKTGSEADVETYYEAFDTLLDDLDVLANEYRFICPCDNSELIFSGGYMELQKKIGSHNDKHHSESRISTMTLVNREVKINDTPEQRTQANQTQKADS